MFKELHNKLGEKGQALTVLSLLEGPAFVGSADISGSLHDVSQRIRDLAGGDEAELVNMYSVYPNEGGSLEFLALELVPLRQAIQRINQINGGSDDSQTVMRVVDRSEESEDWEASEEAGLMAGPDSAGDGTVGQAMSHLRDAMRSLFNRAGERGEALTVLSLLSEPVPRQRPQE
jgi:hypothetical protein